MSNLDIRIDIKKFSHMNKSLAKNLEDDVLELLVKSFADYILRLYFRMIEESINSRRYKGNWEPIEDKSYLEYLGTTPVSDILICIREALKIKKIGYNFVVTFDDRYNYPGSRIPLVQVLRAVDSGNKEINARPIFRNITYPIQGNLTKLWKGYLTMKGVL